MSEKKNIFVGCSGYFYWSWKGKFYPEDMKPSQWFKFYAKYFNTVEINSTFYRFPTRNSLRKWYRDSPENFKFAVKVNREITHLHRLKNIKDRLKEFYDIVDETLKEKVGVFLFQMPPSFKYSEENLHRIVENLDPSRRNVVEFRHNSWWREEVFEAFEKNNITFCSISAPDFEDQLVQTSSLIYIRFHGKNAWYNHLYSKEELKWWWNQVREKNFQQLYIYFNNDTNAYAPRNALEMIEIINQ